MPLSLVAMFVGVYSVAVYSRWRVPYLIWLLLGAGLLGVLFPASSPSMPAWALMLVAGIGVWLAGNTVRERNARAQMLEERAQRLERERELSTQIARADERERIARELHDVVAHSVSVMVVQAGAARTTLTRQPDRAAQALMAVESSGREALRELRQLLGLLTDHTSGASMAPQPGLDQLNALVDRVGQAGLAVDLTAYRIPQEALTNALKYAKGAVTHVRVAFDETELRLEVVDSGGTRSEFADGAGRGLVGIQERVAMFGGDLELGERPEGGFAVRARLPLPA